jgi:hypothetical protein
MSADVAPQGIAQDIVTLVIAIPLLLYALFYTRTNPLKGRLLLAGVLGYFLVTYLFYLMMGTINSFFLIYAALLCCSFFAFILTLLSIDLKAISGNFNIKLRVKPIGGFLMFNAVAIALLWLSITATTITGHIPAEVQHYTTLVVQGLDLGLLLPICFVAGLLLYRRDPWGYLLAPVYLVFLSILMTALTAKVIAIGLLGGNIFPVVIIIPLFNIISIVCSVVLFKNVAEHSDRL